MDVKYIDLEKYANMLKEVRKLQMEHEIKQHKSNRIALISYTIFSRLLFDRENVILAKRKEKFDLILDKVESEIKETTKKIKFLCGLDSWKGFNDEESKKQLVLFVPDRYEWSLINSLRRSSFEAEKEDYDRIMYFSTKESLEGIVKDFKEKLYQKIYENGRVSFYKIGCLIPIVVDKKNEKWKELLENERNSKSVGIGIDLGMYDFVQYLEGQTKEQKIKELESTKENKNSQIIEGISTILPNYKNKAHDFNDIFTSNESKDTVINVMKYLDMIDDNFNYLSGSNRSMIRALLLVSQKNGLIYSDIDITPLIKILGKKLNLSENLRVNSCRDYEQGKVSKAIDKFSCK